MVDGVYPETGAETLLKVKLQMVSSHYHCPGERWNALLAISSSPAGGNSELELQALLGLHIQLQGRGDPAHSTAESQWHPRNHFSQSFCTTKHHPWNEKKKKARLTSAECFQQFNTTLVKMSVSIPTWYSLTTKFSLHGYSIELHVLSSHVKLSDIWVFCCFLFYFLVSFLQDPYNPSLLVASRNFGRNIFQWRLGEEIKTPRIRLQIKLFVSSFAFSHELRGHSCDEGLSRSSSAVRADVTRL